MPSTDPLRSLRSASACAIFLAGSVAFGLPAGAKPPLSANEWLSGSVQEPPHVSAWRPGDARPADAGGKGARRGALPPGTPGPAQIEPVQVQRLDGENPDRAGTLPPRLAGLSAGLWGDTPASELRAQIAGLPVLRLPALAQFERRVWLARLDPPPPDAGTQTGDLFIARVDRLLALGAIDAARALLVSSGADDSEAFRRRFDIALLQGEEMRACAIMDATPGIAPSFAARIMCLAMGGDWNAAALTFRGAQSLGLIEPDTQALLEHYLDDGFTDLPDLLTVPERPSPLTYRLHETIGQPLSTTGLPLVFAQADLRANTGWKAQLEAAERLARAGSLSPARLRALYTERQPAASGGVWERVRAVQSLLAATAVKDQESIARAAPEVLHLMAAAGLVAPLGDMVAADLAGLPLEGEVARLALRLGLYAGDRDTEAEAATLAQHAAAPGDAPDAARLDAFLIALIRGATLPDPGPGDGASAAGRAALLRPVFEGGKPALDAGFAALINDNRRGEALLAALAAVDQGMDGDFNRAAEGLRVMRVLGLEDTARRAALQLILAPWVQEAAARAPDLPEADDAETGTGFAGAIEDAAITGEETALTGPAP